jgi:BASS family bile acid:Na+ symporter
MDLSKLPRWFPLWAVLGSALAYAFPKYLLEARASIVPLLGIVMFGMGMTLSAKDFVSVLRRPGMVFLGVSLQYLLMPFIGWVLAGMAGLSAGLMAGVVLLRS